MGGGQRPASSLVRGLDREWWAQMSTARGGQGQGWGQQTMGTRTLRIYKTNYWQAAAPCVCVSGCSFWNEERVVFTSYSVAGGPGEATLWRG